MMEDEIKKELSKDVYDKVTRSTSSSKKEAKKTAAFQMLQYVLEEG